MPDHQQAPPTILLAESRYDVEHHIRRSLVSVPASIDCVWNTSEALECIRRVNPALIIVGIHHNIDERLATLMAIRAVTSTPVIAILLRDELCVVLSGYHLGADLVLLAEERARLAGAASALLRRSTGAVRGTGQTYRYDGLEICLQRQRVTVDGTDVEISPREFGLLALLARYAGTTLTPREILATPMGAQYEGSTAHLHRDVLRLRRRLTGSHRIGRHLLIQRGMGYHLVAPLEGTATTPMIVPIRPRAAA